MPKNGSLAFGNSLFDHASHSPVRKIHVVVSFTTKYALFCEIKPRILQLSIRRRQNNSSIVLTHVACKEIDRYRRDVVSAGQLGATTARTLYKSLFHGFFYF